MRCDDSRVLETLGILADRCTSWLLNGCTSELQFLLFALPEVDAAETDLTMNCAASGNVRAEFLPLVRRMIASLQAEPDDDVDARVAALGAQWQLMQTRKEECMTEISNLCACAGRARGEREVKSRLEFLLGMTSPLIHRTFVTLFGPRFHYLLVTIIPCEHDGMNFDCSGTGNYDAEDLKRATVYVDKLGVALNNPLRFLEPMGNA